MPQKRRKRALQPTAQNVNPVEKAPLFPSSIGNVGGSAGSARIDNPDRKTGKIPILTRGEPSTSPDVSASQLMQNVIMNDDDKEWYDTLFKKQSKLFLQPRNTVANQPDIGLNCALVFSGGLLSENSVGVSYGVFIPVPNTIVRQLEALYPAMLDRFARDASPAHISVVLTDDLSDEQATRVKPICMQVLSAMQPFQVELCGTGHFFNDDASVFHVRVSSPRLSELHEALSAALQTSGIPVKSHPTYQGHITLAYLPSGQQQPEIPIVGSWVVDRVEVWNRTSPISLKMGKATCLGCVSGLCRVHIAEGKRRVINEPDDTDEKSVDDGSEQTDEASGGGAAAGGDIRGYVLPMGRTNLNKRQRRKRLKISAGSFGGGSFV